MGRTAEIFRGSRALMWLAGINAAVFLLMAALSFMQKAGVSLPLAPALLFELPDSARMWTNAPWTLVTYMFTHENFLHLFINILWLLWFGGILLQRLADRQLAWLYLGGGLCGGLLYMACHPLFPSFYGGPSLLLGASASVLAMMSAAALLMPDYTLHLFFLGDVKLKWMAVAMIVLAFLGLGGGNTGGEIAHIGGVAYGLMAALFLKRKKRQPRRREPRRRNPFRKMRSAADVPAHNAVEREKSDSRRLDELLDKIHTSGFNSLTRAERTELEELSRRVTR